MLRLAAMALSRALSFALFLLGSVPLAPPACLSLVRAARAGVGVHVRGRACMHASARDEPLVEGVFGWYPEIGDHSKKVLLNP